MFFSETALKELGEKFETVKSRHDELRDAYCAYKFKQEAAREFAIYGFVRRINILKQCVSDVFALLPPESDDVPAIETRTDAVICIQAFVINAFGAIDNLAWVWVKEKSITKKDGNPLPNNWVGLRRNNKLVVSTLSDDLQVHLAGLAKWFGYLEEFRHALAHRIPLYIPPYTILKANEDEYARLYKLMNELGYNPEEYQRISQELAKLKRFVPSMLHSSKSAPFHPQMLSDFEVVIQLGWKMLSEFEREIDQQELRCMVSRCFESLSGWAVSIARRVRLAFSHG